MFGHGLVGQARQAQDARHAWVQRFDDAAQQGSHTGRQVRDAQRQSGTARVQRRDLKVAVVTRAADGQRTKRGRVFQQGAHGELRDVARTDKVARFGARADELHLALFEQALAIEFVRVVLHEGGGPQDHRVQAAGPQHLLDGMFGAEKVDRVVGPCAPGRGVDEALYANCHRRGNQRAVAGIVDHLHALPAPAQQAVGAGQHPRDTGAGALDRDRIGQVPSNHLGAKAGQVDRLLRMATERTHREPLRTQHLNHRPAQGAGGADNEDRHGSAFCAWRWPSGTRWSLRRSRSSRIHAPPKLAMNWSRSNDSAAPSPPLVAQPA